MHKYKYRDRLVDRYVVIIKATGEPLAWNNNYRAAYSKVVDFETEDERQKTFVKDYYDIYDAKLKTMRGLDRGGIDWSKHLLGEPMSDEEAHAQVTLEMECGDGSIV